ncbi:hypothetical protein DFJ73DRAFT_757397 [Zopfochytrium polystomum]|nr:hypothetical protein DFJ73DRAFT_757397 [Zopfochytrium polystomum]
MPSQCRRRSSLPSQNPEDANCCPAAPRRCFPVPASVLEKDKEARRGLRSPRREEAPQASCCEKKLRLEVIAAAQGLAPAAPVLPQFPPAITDIDALFLGPLLKEVPAIDATAVEKLVVEPVEAPVATTLPVAVLAPSATADTPDSAAVATEFVIDLDVSDNEAASVTHDSTPDGAQSPAADGLFNAIDNLGATR